MTTSIEVKFYQNNPCIVVRDVNELFCEIQLNVHFATTIEAEYYCTPSECRAPLSGGEAAQEEREQAEAILEDIQNEEHSIICMVEKRLLHDAPIEACTIANLQQTIDKQNAEFAQTKELHEEWRSSAKGYKAEVKALQAEIASLQLAREAALNIKDLAVAGIKKLREQHSKLVVQIDRGNTRISMAEYNELEKRDAILRALEHGGVDNWEWFEESLKNASLI